MKVKLYIIIDNLGPGGTQRQIIEYLKTANREQFDIKIVNLDKDYNTLKDEIERLGYEVIGIKQGKWRAVNSLFGLFKQNKLDIVHTFLFTSDLYGRIAAKLAGVPVVISSVRNIDLWQKWHHRLTDKILATFTDRITVNAECIKPYLIKTKGIPQKKIITIYNGIDLARFDNLKTPQQIREELGIPLNSLAIGMVSRFSAQKDYDTFLKAAEIILKTRGQAPAGTVPSPHSSFGESPVYFVAVGDGPLLQSLQSSVVNQQLKDKIIFTGLRRDIPNVINAMDICILSSHYEGCPNVILEYMASSKPVIASNVGGCAELIIEGKTGFVVPPKNPEMLANKIRELINNKDLRIKMGKEGRIRVEKHFTSQLMVKNIENLYLELLNPKIAYILSQFPETHETFILREIKALKEKGTAVKIFSLKKSRDKIIHPEALDLIKKTIYGRLNILSILFCVLRYPIKTLSSFGYLLKTYGTNPKELIKALYVFLECLCFVRVLKKEKIAHIHSHWATIPTTAAVILSKFTGIPFSFTAHAWDIFISQRGLKEKINKSKFVLTCTDYNHKFLAGLCDNEQAGKIYLNYHGVDLKSKSWGQAPSGTVPNTILAIGRLVETKGFEYLIEACAILAKKGIAFECKIVGTGPLKKRLADSVERIELKDRIKFLGLQTQEQIKKLFAEATMLVQPSVMAKNGDRDGIPNVILEAMAYGTPVIATDFSGIPEAIIDGDTGILIKAKDSLAIAEAIEKLFLDPDLRQKLALNARRLVENRFNIDTNINQLLEIFKNNAILKR